MRVEGEYTNGYKSWWLNGLRHREDGPAVEYADGSNEWWLNGVKMSEEDFLKESQPTKELSVEEIEKLLGYKVKVIK